jgi:aminoglycoside phosphotransferase (APT) family kinase protein
LREDSDLASGQKPETEKRDGAKDHSLSLSDFSASSRAPSALRVDPELPFLEMAWSPSQMQEFFNHSVLPLVWPGQEVTAVAIEHISYKAGKQCELLYALQFSDPTSSQSRQAVVTFANENTLGETYRHHYGGENGTAAGPTPSPVVFLPQYGCLVEFFPRDWDLPGLVHAIDPEEMAPLLSQVGSEAEWSDRLPQVEVLRYRLRKRCVLRYRVETPDYGAPLEVIGKVHNSGPLTVRVAQTQSILHPQAAACGLIIPKPLRVVQEWGFLLMERVSGTVIQPLVKQARAPEGFKEVIGLAAVALAKLHRLRCESQQVLSLQTRLAKLRKRAAPLPLVAPLLAQQVETLLQQIARASVQFTAVAPSFIHGDFSPGQLLLDKGQIAIVDFDSASLGDPAIDVGIFMARLHYIAVLRAHNEFRQLAAYFLSEYQARLPENRVAERIHLFLSAALIRKALRAFERWPYDYSPADPDSRPALLLQEAAACLSRH